MKRILFMALMALLPMLMMAQKQGGEVKRPTPKAQERKLSPSEMRNMGIDYEYGQNGKTKNLAEAFKWYKKAAEAGDLEGQYKLGVCYDWGKGVPQDAPKGAYWYCKAAERGHVYAQYMIGLCYDKGVGVEQDYIQAVYWYKKSADQGYAYAQVNLGNCYYQGKGIGKDNSMARYWWQKAADQGDETAINNLKLLD